MAVWAPSWEIQNEASLPLNNLLMLFHLKSLNIHWGRHMNLTAAPLVTAHVRKNPCLCHPLSSLNKNHFIHTKWNCCAWDIPISAPCQSSYSGVHLHGGRNGFAASAAAEIQSTASLPHFSAHLDLFCPHSLMFTIPVLKDYSLPSLLCLSSPGLHLNNHIAEAQLFLTHQYHCNQWARVHDWIPTTVPWPLSSYQL